MDRMVVIALCWIGIASVGCAPDKPPTTAPGLRDKSHVSAEAVAVVNGEPLTYNEFARRIGSLTPYARARYASLDARKAFLDRQIDFELLADRAEELGFGDQPEVVHIMKETMIRQMLQQELFQKVRKADIKDAEIESLYRANLPKYRRPEARRVSVQTFMDEATALKSLAVLKALGPEERSKDGWQKLGFVDDPASKQAKNTGRNKKLAKVVFGLGELGELSTVFELDGRWVIATFVQRKPSHTVDLADVEDEIRDKLYLEKREAVRLALVESLRNKADVTIDDEALAAVPLPASSPGRSLTSPRPVRDLKGPKSSSQKD